MAQIHQDKVKSNRERVSYYKKYINTVNYDGKKFPVAIKDVAKIERQNNISFWLWKQKKQDFLYMFQQQVLMCY